MKQKSFSLTVLSFYKLTRTILFYHYLILKIGLHGVWLGILSKKQLDKIVEIYFSDQQKYIDDSYTLKGLFSWEEAVINSYFLNCKNLLLTGAGGGRELYGLTNYDYYVEAYECNLKLLNYANDFFRRKGIDKNIKYIEPNKCPQLEKTFDGAIIGWASYMHIQGKSSRISFLRQIRKNLTPNSPILISFYTRSNERRFKLVSKIANAFRYITFRELTDEGDDLVPFYAHSFSKDDILNELNVAGFELVLFKNEPYGHAVGISKSS